MNDEAEKELAMLQAENQRLREAIRRLAEQDATLSVCEGNVTVTMDAALTDAERDLLEWLAAGVDDRRNTHQTLTPAARAVIRGLLDRLGGER